MNTDASSPALGARQTAAVSRELPRIAVQCVDAIVTEVPAYRVTLRGDLRIAIEQAVQLALAGFLRLAAGRRVGDPSTPIDQSLAGAYELGRGEAKSGRRMDSLLSAYRVGARTAWREMSSLPAVQKASASDVAHFAELVFAYIDELSASSVTGHVDELTDETNSRGRLANALLAERDPATIETLAAETGWALPESLTAVLVAPTRLSMLLGRLPDGWLRATDDPGRHGLTVFLVPGGRGRLLTALGDRRAYVGCTRPWAQVTTSYGRAARAAELDALGAFATVDGPIDTDAHLSTLVLNSDVGALADLRARVLAPLAEENESSRDRLAETLRSWLLHQGRRDAVAAELHVHPQTVRYRMTRIRELFGDSLDDPLVVRDLVIALG